METEYDLPAYVKKEFDAFLDFGILINVFLRLHCSDCQHEKRVAFFCKKRGLYPSCGTRCMTGSAAHLVYDEASIENSLIFTNVKIGGGVVLKNCIIDKDVEIPEGEWMV